MTGTRPAATSMQTSMTRLCSSCDRVGVSPVVPTGTSPLVPSSICQFTNARKAFSSNAPSESNGVTSAVIEPFSISELLRKIDGTSCHWSLSAVDRNVAEAMHNSLATSEEQAGYTGKTRVIRQFYDEK